ncbi:hypothetical protein DUI87_20268 [Hirundo rustica rustica]|uniref:Uncharacterized protein n=1 Tax=Hirundo rustica rustica TaxID=333673 RepID=A0A3M0JQS9_HIRRU|nr:hypothetical protein DUI87_20268 [Hirundo rustica rustica]
MQGGDSREKDVVSDLVSADMLKLMYSRTKIPLGTLQHYAGVLFGCENSTVICVEHPQACSYFTGSLESHEILAIITEFLRSRNLAVCGFCGKDPFLKASFLFSHTGRLADRANQILLAIDPEKLEGDEFPLPTDVIVPEVAECVPEQPARLWLRVNLALENSCAPHLSVVPTSHISVNAGIILTV